MKITFEKEIENCYECPFREYIYEQGFCGECCRFNVYQKIPCKGILKSCPFLKGEKSNGTK